VKNKIIAILGLTLVTFSCYGQVITGGGSSRGGFGITNGANITFATNTSGVVTIIAASASGDPAYTNSVGTAAFGFVKSTNVLTTNLWAGAVYSGGTNLHTLAASATGTTDVTNSTGTAVFGWVKGTNASFTNIYAAALNTPLLVADKIQYTNSTTDYVMGYDSTSNAVPIFPKSAVNTNPLVVAKFATNVAWNITCPLGGSINAITNTLGGSTANLWITNVVDGGFFVARVLVDGTARTVSVTNASGLTLKVISTNGFSVLTLPQIPITANKLATICGRAWIVAGTTNVDLWANVEQ